MLSRDAEGKWMVPTPDGVVVQIADETTARETQRAIEFVARVRDVAARLLEVHRDILALGDLRETLDLATSNVVSDDVVRGAGLTAAQFWAALAAMEQQARGTKAERALLLRLARSAAAPGRFG